MDLDALSGLGSFTSTALMLTAAICLVAIFVAWYTVRRRIKMSQVILGLFSYVLVMLLENIFSLLRANLGLKDTGIALALYQAAAIMFSRELIRFMVMKFAMVDRFGDTDAAIGFGLGFGGLYLLTCGLYYFNCYSAVREFLNNGADAFFANAGTDSQEAYELLLTISQQNGWQYLLTGVNRVFFLVREISLSVLAWYGLTSDKMRWCLLLVPAAHFIAMLPDCLFDASVLTNSYLKDVLTCLISAGIAFVAARTYNAREDQAAHYQVEKLRARRRR